MYYWFVVENNVTIMILIEYPTSQPINQSICIYARVYVGYLRGLAETGILDTVSYMATLSGSSWATAAWMAVAHSNAVTRARLQASGVRDTRYTSSDPSMRDIEDLTTHLRESVQRPLSNPIDATLVRKMVARRLVYNQPFTLVDAWGAMIYNNLIGSMQSPPHCLSDQADVVLSGTTPLPLYTAVSPHTTRRRTDYQWHCFSPFEWQSHIEDRACTAQTPVWAFGRRFEHGVSVDHAPEQHLALMLGMFGSAFCAPLKAALRERETLTDITSQIRYLQDLDWHSLLESSIADDDQAVSDRMRAWKVRMPSTHSVTWDAAVLLTASESSASSRTSRCAPWFDRLSSTIRSVARCCRSSMPASTSICRCRRRSTRVERPMWCWCSTTRPRHELQLAVGR